MEKREFEFELSLVFFWAFEEAEKSRWLLGFKRDITLKKQKHKKQKTKNKNKNKKNGICILFLSFHSAC